MAASTIQQGRCHTSIPSRVMALKRSSKCCAFICPSLERLAQFAFVRLDAGLAGVLVGVCDMWALICAERASVIPIGGSVAVGMLRSVAGHRSSSTPQ
eukprot:5752095-Amphidinium_carterae.1